jgi:hypothetical protein
MGGMSANAIVFAPSLHLLNDCKAQLRIHQSPAGDSPLTLPSSTPTDCPLIPMSLERHRRTLPSPFPPLNTLDPSGRQIQSNPERTYYKVQIVTPLETNRKKNSAQNAKQKEPKLNPSKKNNDESSGLQSSVLCPNMVYRCPPVSCPPQAPRTP